VTDFIVAIPTQPRYDRLSSCLGSIIQNEIQPRELCIVDNGGGYRPIQRGPRCPVRVVNPGRNLGIAGAWNLVHKLYAPADVVYCAEDVELGRDVLGALAAPPDAFAVASGERRLWWSCFLQREHFWDAVGEYDDGFWPEFFADHD
jgi:GT2 family glycosyltransferase